MEGPMEFRILLSSKMNCPVLLLTNTWAEGRKSAGTTTLALMDRGDFLLLTALPLIDFFIGLNVSTSLLLSSSGDYKLIVLCEKTPFGLF